MGASRLRVVLSNVHVQLEINTSDKLYPGKREKRFKMESYIAHTGKQRVGGRVARQKGLGKGVTK